MRKFNNKILLTLSAALVFTGIALGEAPVDNLQKVYDLMEFKQADKDVTAKLRDGTKGIHENAFYWMMKKTSTLPQLTKNQLNRLDSPSYTNMLRSPDRYRFMPIKMRVYIYTVQKLTTENGFLVPSPFWNSDKPIYRIHATNEAAGQAHRIEPLIIYSDKLPPKLPENFQKNDDGTKEYRTGPLYEIAGIFFKYTDEKNRDNNAIVSYPVVLAWQFNNTRTFQQKNIITKVGMIVVILIIVLGGAAYFFLRKRLRAIRKPLNQSELFHSLDDVFNDDDDDIDPNSAIPPELAQAAKDYRKLHGLDEEPRKD